MCLELFLLLINNILIATSSYMFSEGFTHDLYSKHTFHAKNLKVKLFIQIIFFTIDIIKHLYVLSAPHKFKYQIKLNVFAHLYTRTPKSSFFFWISLNRTDLEYLPVFTLYFSLSTVPPLSLFLTWCISLWYLNRARLSCLWNSPVFV